MHTNFLYDSQVRWRLSLYLSLSIYLSLSPSVSVFWKYIRRTENLTRMIVFFIQRSALDESSRFCHCFPERTGCVRRIQKVFDSSASKKRSARKIVEARFFFSICLFSGMTRVSSQMLCSEAWASSVCGADKTFAWFLSNFPCWFSCHFRDFRFCRGTDIQQETVFFDLHSRLYFFNFQIQDFKLLRLKSTR